MELQDFKDTWEKDKKELYSRIEINESKIKKLTLDKTQSKFDKILNFSMLGRNLALVYFLISLFLAQKELSNLKYSIPAIFGGFAMLFSFFQHLKIKKPNYTFMNVIDFQKAIQNFRIHTKKHTIYDISIVSLWFITITPIVSKVLHNKDIYANINHFKSKFIIVLIFLLVVLLVSYYIYKKWNKELMSFEKELEEIKEYEKE